MVRGTSTMMITPVDRAQQGQSVNILRAKEMISERERERERETETETETETERQRERETDGSQLTNYPQ